ncbi:MAG: hypothetical protein RQ875_05235 [Vicingaceae bacterium]|nr:hypothetical protein [Vicingaceae bacterium]
MKKIGIIFIGLLMASPLFSQSDVKLSVCGKTTIEISSLDKCRSIEVDQDGFKVYGFTVSFETADKKVIRFSLENNEILRDALEAIKKHQPTSIKLSNINLINAGGESVEISDVTIGLK